MSYFSDDYAKEQLRKRDEKLIESIVSKYKNKNRSGNKLYFSYVKNDNFKSGDEFLKIEEVLESIEKKFSCNNRILVIKRKINYYGTTVPYYIYTCDSQNNYHLFYIKLRPDNEFDFFEIVEDDEVGSLHLYLETFTY